MRTNFEHLREYEDLFELITSAEATLVAGGNRVTYETAGVNIRRTLEGLLYHLTEKYDVYWEEGDNYNNLRMLVNREIISQSTYEKCDDIRKKCNPSAHFEVNPKSLEQVKADVLDSYEKLYIASYEMVNYYMTDSAVKTYFEQSEYVAERKRKKEEYEQRKLQEELQQAKKREEFKQRRLQEAKREQEPLLRLTGGAEPRSLYEIVKEFSYLNDYEGLCQTARETDKAMALVKQDFTIQNYDNCKKSMESVLSVVKKELWRQGIEFYPTKYHIRGENESFGKWQMENVFGRLFVDRRTYVSKTLENKISSFNSDFQKKENEELIMNSYEILKRMILQLSERQLSKEAYDSYKREEERKQRIREENKRKKEARVRAEKRAKKAEWFIATAVWIGIFIFIFSIMAGM